ncbi:DUF2207 domain-containing protein [Microbacterium sp.]|uniref:DUF2207 domain-containing protein n=1 Tax=Microbacterium sp. TaxID=51671 RepID=UPI0028119546|nr:DUF2207 domain-containing protein [Microbacterium sp.]
MRALPNLRRIDLRRRLIAAAAVLLALLAGSVLSASAASAEVDVDDFDYSSWNARYEVSLDDHGRAVAHVTETMVAEFPGSDQNKGIVRGYPERYQGAGLSLSIRSVTDGAGRPVPYETESDDGVLYVLTGDDSYVHGSTTYVIEYTMRDVMIAGGETGRDEFYWDLLPLDSTQAIGSFRADVVFDPELAGALTGDAACYRGEQGSARTCSLDGPADVDGAAMFSVSSGERAAGDGVTIAVGFEPGTVTQPESRTPNPLADIGPAVVAGGSLAAGAGVLGSVAAFTRRRRVATGVIIAQYDVPADMPPLAAAPLIPGADHPVPAQLVHLAVRGALRIEEAPSAKGGASRPSLRLLDRGAAASDLDLRTLDALFGGEKTVRTLPAKSEKFSGRMAKLLDRGVEDAARRGWTTKERSPLAAAFGWISAGLLACALAFLIWSISLDRDTLPLAVIAFIVAAVGTLFTLFIAFARHTVLTPDGARWHEHLMGVREFIRVAEADRIRMLQSYEGAERRADGGVDTVLLYEHLLPYAMLLGEEKSWAKVLEQTYADAGTTPAWTDAARGTGFALWMSSFSSSTQSAATYSSPTSGSSSGVGGSTGGGFSGGGGGGGFSGGR